MILKLTIVEFYPEDLEELLIDLFNYPVEKIKVVFKTD